MGYLEDFQEQLEKNNFHKFFQLWEEYCTSDTVDPQEFIALLKAVKKSESGESLAIMPKPLFLCGERLKIRKHHTQF